MRTNPGHPSLTHTHTFTFHFSLSAPCLVFCEFRPRERETRLCNLLFFLKKNHGQSVSHFSLEVFFPPSTGGGEGNFRSEYVHTVYVLARIQMKQIRWGADIRAPIRIARLYTYTGLCSSVYSLPCAMLSMYSPYSTRRSYIGSLHRS